MSSEPAVSVTTRPTPGAVATAVVVPHTHWDREWYAPFEEMRFHLVRFFDELLDVVESDPDLPVFLLDGQAVILEDYLEIRRDQRERVERLVAPDVSARDPATSSPTSSTCPGRRWCATCSSGAAWPRSSAG